MFDFIRKPDLWSWFDAPWAGDIQSGPAFTLKTIQDLAVYSHLHELEGQDIAEIGGGHSRVLGALTAANRCVNVEPFEGRGNGPKDALDIKGAERIDAYLGEESPALAPGRFDVVFSISVVEHVPQDRLEAFFLDGMRILKPGGLWLHAIDMYIGDQPTPSRARLLDIYRKWAARPGLCEPVGAVAEVDPAFTCDMATNPDNIMHQWGRISPTLIERRLETQSVSVLVASRKT